MLDCRNVCNSVYSGFSFLLYILFCHVTVLDCNNVSATQFVLDFWVFVVHRLRFQSKCVSNFFWSLNESWKWLFRTSLLTVDCMALSGGGWPTGWQEGMDEWPWLSFHSRTQQWLSHSLTTLNENCRCNRKAIGHTYAVWHHFNIKWELYIQLQFRWVWCLNKKQKWTKNILHSPLALGCSRKICTHTWD